MEDFKTIKKELTAVLKPFDHHLLNDVAPFLIKNPTSENLAETIFKQLGKRFKSVAKVIVWESTTTYASYY
jgi:6-pyruvoyl-tetrahydropterin synthase